LLGFAEALGELAGAETEVLFDFPLDETALDLSESSEDLFAEDLGTVVGFWMEDLSEFSILLLDGAYTIALAEAEADGALESGALWLSNLNSKLLAEALIEDFFSLGLSDKPKTLLEGFSLGLVDGFSTLLEAAGRPNGAPLTLGSELFSKTALETLL